MSDCNAGDLLNADKQAALNKPIIDPSTDSYVFVQVKNYSNTQNYKPSLEIVTGVIDGDLVDAVLIFLGDAKAPSVSESFFLRL